jgi:hypothetical protein
MVPWLVGDFFSPKFLLLFLHCVSIHNTNQYYSFMASSVHIWKRGSWGLVNQKWEVRPADRGITRIRCLGLRPGPLHTPSKGFMCVMACHMCEEKTACPYEICKSLPRNIRWPLVSEGNLVHLRHPPNTLGHLWNVIKLTIKSAKVSGDKLGNNNTKVI